MVNAHQILDELRLQLAKEVLRTFALEEIRRRSLANLDRWEKIGTWGSLYADWRALLTSGTDEQVISVMTGSDDRSVQLRQAMPYVGILNKDTVERLRRETVQRGCVVSADVALLNALRRISVVDQMEHS